MWYVTWVSSFLLALVMGAFVFVSLVVVGYAGPVGWATVGFCVIFGVGLLGGIIYQSPIFMKGGESEMLSPVAERQDRPFDGHNEEKQPKVQESYVGNDQWRGKQERDVHGYHEDWRYSRNGARRVDEYNNRLRAEAERARKSYAISVGKSEY